MITVYAWYPWQWYDFALGRIRTEKGDKTAGHATMAYTSPGGYISLWTGSKISESYANDICAYGRLPHRKVEINGLDEQAIHEWWQIFKKEIRSGMKVYSRLGLNCAMTVSYALEAGCGGMVRGWDSWNSIWSPVDALEFAEAVKAAFEKSRPGDRDR